MDNPSLLYYQHSGNYSASGALGSLLGGAAAAVVLAFVYAYVILYCPFIYINFFASVFFGGAVGFVGTNLLKRQKVRNSQVAAMIGVVLGVIAVWAHWVVWMYAFLGRADVEERNLLVLALNPSFLWSLILEVNNQGAWDIKGSTPTGGVLWAVWGLEALLIGGASFLVAKSMMDSDPYCESCGSWCTEEGNIAELQPCDPAELKRHMESKDLGFLERLGGRAADASNWMQVGLHKCKQCGMTNTLKVDEVTVKVDKKNKESKSTKTVLENLLVSSTECETIHQIGRRLSTPVADAKAS
ncbi:MAG TPA: hypothetical protein VH394_29415 [Thermoanaerobaculia bacterium]|jgi:hypothetical protein|nr:hypothetical protein [Thermoanaerobaculia bacterium]